MAGERGKEMKKKAMGWKKLAEDAASRCSGSSRTANKPNRVEFWPYRTGS